MCIRDSHLGVAGAALATGLGQCIPAVAGILYFTFARKGLRFTRPEFSKGLLSTSCFNGSSEMVSNLSAAVVTYLLDVYKRQAHSKHRALRFSD